MFTTKIEVTFFLRSSNQKLNKIASKTNQNFFWIHWKKRTKILLWTLAKDLPPPKNQENKTKTKTKYKKQKQKTNKQTKNYQQRRFNFYIYIDNWKEFIDGQTEWCTVTNFDMQNKYSSKKKKKKRKNKKPRKKGNFHQEGSSINHN